MSQILGMALPFFGLSLLGYIAARIKNLPVDGLTWMNFFIIYVALPALFFNLLSQTPIEELASWVLERILDNPKVRDLPIKKMLVRVASGNDQWARSNWQARPEN